MFIPWNYLKDHGESERKMEFCIYSDIARPAFMVQYGTQAKGPLLLGNDVTPMLRGALTGVMPLLTLLHGLQDH